MSERILQDALEHAEEVRAESGELKLLAGADSDVFDIVLLADEIERMRKIVPCREHCSCVTDEDAGCCYCRRPYIVWKTDKHGTGNSDTPES